LCRDAIPEEIWNAFWFTTVRYETVTIPGFLHAAEKLFFAWKVK
jgi:hypothetical protein